MILSIIVYTLSAFLLYRLGRFVSLNSCSSLYLHNSHRYGVIYWFFIYLIFGFIAGARYDVGVDHLAYLSDYNLSSFIDHNDNIEPLFWFFTKFLSGLGFHYFFYFAIIAIVQIGLIYASLKSNKQLIPYVGALVMLGPYFLNWMNGIRQTLVSCLFVYLVSVIITVH